MLRGQELNLVEKIMSLLCNRTLPRITEKRVFVTTKSVGTLYGIFSLMSIFEEGLYPLLVDGWESRSWLNRPGCLFWYNNHYFSRFSKV